MALAVETAFDSFFAAVVVAGFGVAGFAVVGVGGFANESNRGVGVDVDVCARAVFDSDDHLEFHLVEAGFDHVDAAQNHFDAAGGARRLHLGGGAGGNEGDNGDGGDDGGGEEGCAAHAKHIGPAPITFNRACAQGL